MPRPDKDGITHGKPSPQPTDAPPQGPPPPPPPPPPPGGGSGHDFDPDHP